MCSPIDPVFEFSEIGHHGIERWSFSKEHLPHVPVVASNLSDVGVWRANPKASRPGQIVPRPSFPEEVLVSFVLGVIPKSLETYQRSTRLGN